MGRVALDLDIRNGLVSIYEFEMIIGFRFNYCVTIGRVFLCVKG